MPRNSSGVYSKPAGTTPTNGDDADATQFNLLMDDMTQALTDSLPRDGSAPMTGALAMGSNKITGLAAAVDVGDVPRFDQVVKYADTSAFGRSLIDDTTAAAARTTLGLGTAATSDFTPVQQGGGTGQLASKLYFGFDGGGVRVQVDFTDFGRIALESTVPTVMAAQSIGSVGTSATLKNNTGVTKYAGDIVSGSSLSFASCAGDVTGTPSGSWRCAGLATGTGGAASQTTQWVRLS